jgi:hypothetical protein
VAELSRRQHKHSALAGMTVALSLVAMLLSELITVYLAAAAPVGVAYFLRQHTHDQRTSRLLRSACAALLWPLALGAQLFTQQRHDQRARDINDTDANRPDELRVATAERTLGNTLHQIDDLLRDTYNTHGTRARHATTAARASIERFVGLALALAATSDDDRPTARELELCRVAGRKGDDLLLAGRCIHRRNLARLRAHHEQARTELIHALAELLETVEHDLLPHGAQTFTQLYWLLIRVFAQTIDLLSLLDDQAAATRIARLLDAACAWARRNDVLNLPSTAATQFGGVLCPPPTQPSNLTHPTQQPAL